MWMSWSPYLHGWRKWKAPLKRQCRLQYFLRVLEVLESVCTDLWYQLYKPCLLKIVYGMWLPDFSKSTTHEWRKENILLLLFYRVFGTVQRNDCYQVRPSRYSCSSYYKVSSPNRAIPRLLQQGQVVKPRPPVAPCAENKKHRLGGAMRSQHSNIKWTLSRCKISVVR